MAWLSILQSFQFGFDLLREKLLHDLRCVRFHVYDARSGDELSRLRLDLLDFDGIDGLALGLLVGDLLEFFDSAGELDPDHPHLAHLTRRGDDRGFRVQGEVERKAG
jgi:hypothetical protein